MFGNEFYCLYSNGIEQNTEKQIILLYSSTLETLRFTAYSTQIRNSLNVSTSEFIYILEKKRKSMRERIDGKRMINESKLYNK